MIFEDTHVAVILVEILNSIVINRDTKMKVILWNSSTPKHRFRHQNQNASKFVVEQVAIQCNGSHLGYNLEFHLSANDMI